MELNCSLKSIKAHKRWLLEYVLCLSVFFKLAQSFQLHTQVTNNHVDTHTKYLCL